MSRVLTFSILGVLLIILGVMSYVVEQAGKPEKPKQPTAEEMHQHEREMQERMKQQEEARKKMLETIKQQQEKGGKKVAAEPEGKRPINPTAPEPPKGKNPLPAGALDITEDWFRKRKPGQAGIKELEELSKQESSATFSPPPQLSPPTPIK